MYDTIQTNKKAFNAEMLFQNNTHLEIVLKLVARDRYKPNSMYADRTVTLKPSQERKILLMFPITPDYMEIYSYNTGNPNPHPKQLDYTYSSKFLSIDNKVKECDVWIDQQTQDFVEFAQWFAQNAGLLSVGEYRSRNGKFIINYIPYITYVEKYTNHIKRSNSPSRIGHISGRIDVSYAHFIRYSIPKRFLILLHEYMHKWGNPKMGRKIEDENGADFLALYIYMGKGYPRADAKDVFLRIFYGNPTEENVKRKNLILQYMDDFDNGKINNLINCKTK